MSEEVGSGHVSIEPQLDEAATQRFNERFQAALRNPNVRVDIDESGLDRFIAKVQGPRLTINVNVNVDESGLNRYITRVDSLRQTIHVNTEVDDSPLRRFEEPVIKFPRKIKINPEIDRTPVERYMAELKAMRPTIRAQMSIDKDRFVRAIDDLVAKATQGFSNVARDAGSALNDALSKGASQSIMGIPAPLIAALVGAVALALPVMGAMISGMLFAVLGGGVIAAGIMLALKDPKIKNAFKEMGKDFMESIKPGLDSFKEKLIPAIETVSAAIKRWGPDISSMLASAGRLLKPLADGIVAFGDGFIKPLTALMKSDFMAKIMGAVSEGFGKIGQALGGVIMDFLKNPEAQKGAVQGLKDVFSLLSGAIKITGEALAGLSATWFKWTQDPDGPGPQKSKVAEFGDAIKSVGKSISDLNTSLKPIGGLMGVLGFAFTNVGMMMKGAAAALQLFAWGTKNMSAMVLVFDVDWKRVWTNVKNWFDDAMRWIKGAWDTAWGAVKTAFSTSNNWIKALWDNVWGHIKSFFEGIWHGIVSALKTAWDNIKQAVESVVNWFKSSVLPVFKSIWDGIATGALWLWHNAIEPAFHGIQAVVQFVVNVVKMAIHGWALIFHDIGSVFMWLWHNVAEPVWNGIKAIVHLAIASMTLAIKGFKIWMDVLGHLFLYFWQHIVVPAWNGIKSVFTTALNFVKNLWDTVWGHIKSFFIGLWNSITGAIIEGWNHIKGPFVEGAHFIQNIWNTVWNAISGFIHGIWTGITTAISAGWSQIKAWFQEGLAFVQNIWNSVWSAIIDFFQNLWGSIEAFIQGVWQRVQDIFSTALQFVQNLWDTVWNAIADFLNHLWNDMLNFLNEAWQHLYDMFSDALNAVKNLWSDVWNAISDFLKNIWDTMKNLVQEAMDAIRSAWEDAWNGIEGILGGIWDKIKGKVADGLNAVIDIINGGIDAINGVLSKIGVSVQIDKIGHVGGGGGGEGHAEGGYITGPGTGTSDSISARLSNGEYVIKADSVAKIGVDKLNHMNEQGSLAFAGPGGDAGGIRVKPGNTSGGGMPNLGFADGGDVSAVIEKTKNWLHEQAGKPYVMGAAGPGAWDCSGLVGGALKMVNGQNPNGRIFSTVDEGRFFENGFGGENDLNVGYVGGGGGDGHTVGSIGGLNFEATPPHVLIGNVQMTPGDSYFTHKGHAKVGGGVAFSGGGSGSGGGGGGLGEFLSQGTSALMSSMISPIINSVKAQMPQTVQGGLGMGTMDLLAQGVSKMITKAISDKGGPSDGSASSGGGGGGGGSNSGSPGDTEVEKQAYEAAKSMNASAKVLLALFEAGFVESGFHNLQTATDHDSLGFLQQRPSSGWPDPLNIGTATHSFVSRAQAKE